MEDILASIRRILAEEEPVPDAGGAINGGVANGGAANGGGANGAAQAGLMEDVLVLDASMLAPASQVEQVALIPPPPPEVPAAAALDMVPPAGAVVVAAVAAAVVNDGGAGHAPDAARPLVIRDNLPCFEDAVRAALQPIIQQWADAALPKLVERMVRTEVERVVGGVV